MTSPSLDTLARLAEAFELDARDLLNEPGTLVDNAGKIIRSKST